MTGEGSEGDPGEKDGASHCVADAFHGAPFQLKLAIARRGRLAEVLPQHLRFSSSCSDDRSHAGYNPAIDAGRRQYAGARARVDLPRLSSSSELFGRP